MKMFYAIDAHDSYNHKIRLSPAAGYEPVDAHGAASLLTELAARELEDTRRGRHGLWLVLAIRPNGRIAVYCEAKKPRVPANSFLLHFSKAELRDLDELSYGTQLFILIKDWLDELPSASL